MTPAVMISRVSLGRRMILTNDAVPKPVGGGRNGDALGTDWKLKDLSDDDPACGTPGAAMLSAKITTETLIGRELTMQRRR